MNLEIFIQMDTCLESEQDSWILLCGQCDFVVIVTFSFFLCRMIINNVNATYTKQQLIAFRLLFST